jgi:hypothetical protein
MSKNYGYYAGLYDAVKEDGTRQKGRRPKGEDAKVKHWEQGRVRGPLLV